jgi:hypothetical protein
MCDSIKAAGEYVLETNELMHRKKAPLLFTTLSDLPDMSFPAIYTFSYLIPYMTQLHWWLWLYLFLGFG